MGTFLYYSRAVDDTMLPALNNIDTIKTKLTEHTQQKAQHFMDYAATYPSAYLRYYASDVVLIIDIDVPYIVLPNAHIQLTAYSYFKKIDIELNDSIHIEYKRIP